MGVNKLKPPTTISWVLAALALQSLAQITLLTARDYLLFFDSRLLPSFDFSPVRGQSRSRRRIISRKNGPARSRNRRQIAKVRRGADRQTRRLGGSPETSRNVYRRSGRARTASSRLRSSRQFD